MENAPGVDGLKQKLSQYRPSISTIALVQQTPTLLLVGVSGAGKSSIKQKLLATGNYHDIVSHTTRAPRENKGIMEKNGREYHFINTEEAERMLDEHEFVEAKIYSGNIYGTSVQEFQKALENHKIALADIEVQGAAEYEAIDPHIKAAFLLPPSYETWQDRLKRRYAGFEVDPNDMKRRMQTAKLELEDALKEKYFRFIINDDLDVAVQAADAIARGAPADKESEAARELAKELLQQLAENL